MDEKSKLKTKELVDSADLQTNEDMLDEIQILKTIYNEISGQTDVVSKEIENIRKQIAHYELAIKQSEQEIVALKNYVPKKIKKSPITFEQFYQENILQLETERNEFIRFYENQKSEANALLNRTKNHLVEQEGELAKLLYLKIIKEEQEAEIRRLEEESKLLRYQSSARLTTLRDQFTKEKDKVIRRMNDVIEEAKICSKEITEQSVINQWQKCRLENEKMTQLLRKKQDNIQNLQSVLLKTFAANARLTYEDIFAADFNYLQLKRLEGLDLSKAVSID